MGSIDSFCLIIASAIAVTVAPQSLNAAELDFPRDRFLLAEMVLEEQGVLEFGDEVLSSDGSLIDVHQFEGRAGQTVTIDVESVEFDPYLLVIDGEGNMVGNHDDISPENTNASLTVTLPNDGTYRAIVNGYDSQSQGRYRLTIATE